SSLSTSNVIRKRSNASSLMSQIHKVCGLVRMVTKVLQQARLMHVTTLMTEWAIFLMGWLCLPLRCRWLDYRESSHPGSCRPQWK
ncbi:hypothetical protein, partial [Agrobacterium tumefaciens]|uniref:hypothetical protein n=1 Tax=Agrobacterium tumefaciens TaxID=358 RepID=UPI001BAD630A